MSDRRYTKARNELFDGLVDVLDKMNEEEVVGKRHSDVVLLAGQRLQLLMGAVEATLKGE